MNYILDKSRLEILMASDETQKFSGDLVAELSGLLLKEISCAEIAKLELRSKIAGFEQTINEQSIEISQANEFIERLKKVICGMFPLWIAAMSYGEHNRAADLDRIRNYYNGRDNPMTSEEIHLMFSLIPDKEDK